MDSLTRCIEKLNNHQTTSVKLVKDAISEASKWAYKNVIGSINPKALEMAEKLDLERKNGHIRSRLHGIPIAIKDNILYDDGTPTTCNSFAFNDFIPPFNASIVDRLIEAGLIPLFKANLSEFAYFMSDEDMPSGYGSMHGQVKHPFDESIDPYGSSTGSAVAVKLGIVPLSIGSETNGSLMAPAYQCQIVSYKPTFGWVSKRGIIPISHTQDTAGPMGNTVKDCALLMDILSFKDTRDPDTLNIDHPLVSKHLNQPLKPSRVGLLSLKNYPYDGDTKKVYEHTKQTLISMGHTVVDLEIEYPKLDNNPTLLIEFKYGMNRFLKEVQGYTHHKSLTDIIEFNQKHADRCLKYGQSLLIKSNNTDGDIHSEFYLNTKRELVETASYMEETMKEQDLIAIATPIWLSFAPIYGNPSVCIPEGIHQGKPKSMVFVGRKHDDETLLRLCHQYELKRNTYEIK